MKNETKGKRYCFFSSQYLPHLGGVERYTYNLAKELISHGNEVIIVTSEIDGQPSYEQNGDIMIFRLPSIQLLNGRFPIVKYNKKTKELLKQISDYCVDYIVVNTRFYPLSYVGARFAKKQDIPSLVIEHGTGHFTVNNFFFDFMGHIYEHIITYLVKRNNDKFYGVSLECNKWLKHFKINAEGVFYNSIDINYIESFLLNKEDDIKKKINYHNDDIIVTFTGRIIKEKGILKLISAIQNIRKKYPNVKLCIAGDGDLYGEIIAHSYDGIYVLGKLEFEKVVQLLKISKIYCLPTDYPEGLPTSILEAIACKVYVITTKAGGSKEVIIDDSYGTILDVNTSESIEKAIYSVIENDSKYKEVVQKAYLRLCEEFSWANTANNLVRAFKGEK